MVKLGMVYGIITSITQKLRLFFSREQDGKIMKQITNWKHDVQTMGVREFGVADFQTNPGTSNN